MLEVETRVVAGQKVEGIVKITVAKIIANTEQQIKAYLGDTIIASSGVNPSKYFLADVKALVVGFMAHGEDSASLLFSVQGEIREHDSVEPKPHRVSKKALKTKAKAAAKAKVSAKKK